MSKSVLLIASTREAEEDLKLADTVIKRVMRKFRKPVRCDFLSHLVVGECARSEAARRVVAAEIQGHDAVLWNCRSTRDSADLDQMRRELDLSVHAHYIAGRCIMRRLPQNLHVKERQRGKTASPFAPMRIFIKRTRCSCVSLNGRQV